MNFSKPVCEIPPEAAATLNSFMQASSERIGYQLSMLRFLSGVSSQKAYERLDQSIREEIRLDINSIHSYILSFRGNRALRCYASNGETNLIQGIDYSRELLRYKALGVDSNGQEVETIVEDFSSFFLAEPRLPRQ